MRVAYVIWSLGLGGAEQMVIELAGGVDRRRFEPLICCLNEPGPFADEARQRGVEVTALGKRGRLDLRVLPALARWLRERRVDLVHTHLWGGNFWGRLAALRAPVPLRVATEHNLDVWKHSPHFLADRCLARRTTRLLAVSHAVREFYESRDVGRGQWRVIHNGVRGAGCFAQKRDPARVALGLDGQAPVVGFVGRLVPAKDPLAFVDVVARASNALPGLQGVVIGDGPERGRLEARIRDLRLETRVTVAGLRRDARELLPALDALVFCSEREGLSVAMLEAMASGVPVVATRVGGTSELIDSGDSGVLVPPAARDEVADRLVELLQNPGERKRMARAAQQRVKQSFSLARMIREHEEAYESCGPRGDSDPLVRLVDHHRQGPPELSPQGPHPAAQ